ncbi:RNA polymerase sigma factor [Parvularcula sp. IMCC14364]|uniref:RNA polymerase sigma factor n=1 Tax=Parvularcula sp. IMCC14364 TaxID=3067902 RepID=UPI002740E9B6|nr:DUF6596 domain-containing protein [Parvularcula sp. IMCC14364]
MRAEESYTLAAETARSSYSRLVAILAARTHDVALAEDVLATAFQSALEHWPKSGVPATPEAWLLTAARRALIDRARHDTVREKAMPDLTMMTEEAHRLRDVSEDLFPDERLKLLFVCAHPAIDPSMHTALMLQTVMGLEAKHIARAFLIAPAAMGQRLVRAKRKIKAAHIPFAIPDRAQLPSRIMAVLDAIYVAFSTGWDEQFHAATSPEGLADEAIWLAQLVTQLLPEEPEARGLLALMLYAKARSKTRRDKNGKYVPLADQDKTLWDNAAISAAEEHLLAASRQNRPGRFQIEAAIQSARIVGMVNDSTNWPAIIQLYARLIEIAPSTGAKVAQASAVALSGRPADAARLLAEIERKCETYQPYWATRAHIAKTRGQYRQAVADYDMAISLATDDAVKVWLGEQRDQICTGEDQSPLT